MRRMRLHKSSLSILSNALLAGTSGFRHIPAIGNAPPIRRQTMHDDFESATWADNHASLSNAIHKLIADIMAGFTRLNAIQFDAPWDRQA
jgi:hypothetical protein